MKKDTHKALRAIYTGNSNVDYRLRAMWALHITKGFSQSDLMTALDDKEPYIRGWAVQLSWEDGAPSEPVIAKFAQMAGQEKSPVVRLYLASAMQRLDLEKRWAIAAGLLQHGEDENDHNLPKMLWFAIEPFVAKDPNKALDLAAKSKLSLIRKYAARRAVDGDKTNTLVTWLGKQSSIDTAMIAGMRDALEGRTDLKTPPDWKTTYAKLQRSGERNKQLSLEIAQFFGDTEAANHYFSTLRNKSAALAERQKALTALASQQRPELVKELVPLLDDAALRSDAIRAIASFDDERLAKLLLSKYPSFSDKDKEAAIQTLASRSRSGWLLALAIKDKSIAKRDIPPSVARQLRRVAGSGFVEIWGPIDQLPSNELAYKKYNALLTPKALNGANMQKGQALFKRTCGSCHKLYGEGGLIGPDLTGSNRSKVDYLLFNVLDPTAEIQDDYKLVVITTRDGRTYSGNIIAENERQITMRIVGQETSLINKSNIQTREVMPVSMLPNGLFETLTDQEVVDLVGYLSRSK
ncbi:MAG: c-type cytochrome [Sphingobacteriales bacterium]|nr:MAG: c-type cytochrome [Sphingobacteriales bacterium]